MTDHIDAPPELMPLEACDCCGVASSYLRGSVWHGRARICAACFYIWYEPNSADPTKPSEIKAERLKRYGDVDVGLHPHLHERRSQ